MKKGTFNRKQLKFLEEYITTGNPAKAYLAAGYKSKTMEAARTSGYRLLRKLDETMDYRGILETVGLTDRRVAEVMKGLVDHPDPRVRVQALNIATKCLGWYEETQNVNLSFQVIIGGREPAQVQGSQEPIKIALKKPIA